jgi:DNA adenine methylase
MVVGRSWHELLKATDPKALTDIQRAARHLYLLKNSYASLVLKLDYKCHVIQPPGFNPDRIPELIEESHRRLARVQIECLPYEEVLDHYDRPTTLFYLDPPYYARKLYRYNLEREDFLKMAELLATLKGKFVLSLNDLPEVRALFKRFKMHTVDLHYTAHQIAGRRHNELLIRNF